LSDDDCNFEILYGGSPQQTVGKRDVIMPNRALSEFLKPAGLIVIISSVLYYLGKTYDEAFYLTLSINPSLLNFPPEHYLTVLGIGIVLVSTPIYIIYNYSRNKPTTFWEALVRNLSFGSIVVLILFYILFWGETSSIELKYYFPRPLETRNYVIIIIFVAYILAALIYAAKKKSMPFNKKKIKSYYWLLLVPVIFISLDFAYYYRGKTKADNILNGNAKISKIDLVFKSDSITVGKDCYLILHNNGKYFVFDTIPDPQRLYIFDDDQIEYATIKTK